MVESEKGLSQLVTCSGAFKDGSLRVVRSGIGIHEQASVEIEGIKGIWSLRSDDPIHDKYLVQSFIGETRVFAMHGEELSEDEIPSFAPGQTLHCANVGSGLILQVTSNCARLIDKVSLASVADFSTDKTITVAASGNEQLVLSFAGGEIMYFDIDLSTRQLVHKASTSLDHEIACLSIRPLRGDESPVTHGESMDMDHRTDLISGRANILAIGTWTENAVTLLALPTMEFISTTNLGVDTQGRDIMLITLENVDYLLVGLGDGTLITFLVQYEAGLPTLRGRRKVVLGTHPISLSCFSNNGSLCVFAACDRSSVIYSRNTKLLFSIVNIPDCTYMTPFHSELFPNCLAFVSEQGFMIGSVDDIQKVHIQTYPLGQSPRRICYSSISEVC